MTYRRYPQPHAESMEILRLIQEGKVNATKISSSIGLNVRTIYRRIKDLREHYGYNIKFTNRGSIAYYYIEVAEWVPFVF